MQYPQDLLRFLYWVIFTPFTLDYHIHLAYPAMRRFPSLFTIWRVRKRQPKFIPLIKLALFHIVVTPLLSFLIAGLFTLAAVPVNWVGVGFGVVLGAILSIALSIAISLELGVQFGVVGGIASGLAIGLLTSASFGATSSGIFGLIIGSAVGLAFGLTVGIAYGAWVGVAIGIVYGALFSIMPALSNGVDSGIPGSLGFGMALGAGFIVSYLRLPIYILQYPIAWGLSLYAGDQAVRLWPFSPVCWDEMIWFPLPRLDQHLLAISRENRRAGMVAISQVAASFRQSWAAQKAMVQLIGDDLQHARTLEAVGAIYERLDWLSEESRSNYKNSLLGLEEISRCARAANEGGTLYNRQEQLRRGLVLIRQVRNKVTEEARLGTAWAPWLDKWEVLFEQELKTLNARETIPNVFVAGSPLATSSKVFKGRTDLFLALESEFTAYSEQRPALLLFGARRTGKTSVIKQLPVRLGPQIVPAEIDMLSAATAENAVGLLNKMAEVIKKACSARHIVVPSISYERLEKDPYPVFQSWLETVEAALGKDRWLLLVLDEYEALGEMLSRGRVDDRIFQMLRVLVQHHRLMILFSGAHTLQDLPPLWSNYLVNVKVLKVNALKLDEASELVTRPIPEFNLDYLDHSEKIILEATACQPYLLQVVCRELVNALNESSRFVAAPEDVNHAIDCAIISAVAYFNDLYNGGDSDDDQRAVLQEIARAKTGTLTASQLKTRTRLPAERAQKAINCLVHREILKSNDGTYQFYVDLVRRWVKEKG